MDDEGEVVIEAPFVGDLISFDTYLNNEFTEEARNGSLYSKLAALAGEPFRISQIRKVRGDGTCFYRAMLYSLLEKALKTPIEKAESVVNELFAIRKIIFECGTAVPDLLGSDLLEAFFDEAVELFDSAIADLGGVVTVADGSATLKFEAPKAPAFEGADSVTLKAAFGSASTAEAATYALRGVTAVQLIRTAEDVAFFLPEPYAAVAEAEPAAAVRSFLDSEVLPSYAYADHVAINALANALAVPVRIISVDAAESPTVEHTFGPTATPEKIAVTLLFRPGHYDVVYSA